MQQWLTQALESGSLGLLALAAAFGLGVISSVACICCTLPFLGAIAGYSGTRKTSGLAATLAAALSLMLGTIIATIILGGVAASFGRVTQLTLGRYWKLLAGFIIVLFGLGALRLLPFELPRLKKPKQSTPKRGLVGAALMGFLLGGAVGLCSLPCNPGIYVVLGAAVLQGYTLWMLTILVAYGVGFSLPLAAIMLGISFGKSLARAQAVQSVIRMAAGALLIAVGFYLLATL